MNFLKTLGGFVGSSATGGLPYVIDTSSNDSTGTDGANSSVVYEGLPDFVLHSGRSKADATHSVSIFKSKQPGNQLTQNALKRIKTLRHPNILSYVDGVEVPNNGPVIIVTEPVRPLAEYLTSLRMQYGSNSEEFQMSVSWGLRSVLLALQFITVDCKLLHGRLTPQSIFVTPGGDWKLGGFELIAELTSDGPSYLFTTFEQSVDANYKSPECQRREWKAIGTGPPYGVDIWAFACLLYYIFNDGQIRSTDLSSASNIPPAIRMQFRKAIDNNAARRPSPQKILASSYFDTPFIQRMDFLENLAVKTSDEKVAFYKDLCANLHTLPQTFGVYKVLPALKAVVEFGAATGTKNGPMKLDPSASHMLPAMVQIGSSLSPEEFKDQVLPIIVKLFSCNDRAVRVQLLQMMEKFSVHFDAKLVNSSVVFDNICSGFTDAAPVLRELTVKSMLHIADKLSDSNLNTRVMKYFAKLQTDPEPAIRTNTTICLGKIAGKLNDTTRPKVLFPAFSRALKDPFPHARLAGLRSMTACEQYFSPQGTANSIIGAITPLLLDVSISVREQATISMEVFMKKITNEAAQMKVREEQQAREQQLKQESGASVEEAKKTEPSTAATNTGGYASSLTSWASSAVVSNVGKLVGAAGGMSSSVPTAASTSTSTPSTSTLDPEGLRTSSYSAGQGAFASATSTNSSMSNTFAADMFRADEDEWGNDDDLDALNSPKDTMSSWSNSQPTNSSFTTPANTVKLSVSRDTTLSVPAKPSTSAFAMDDNSGWGDDNWGNDDDLDLTPNTNKLSLGSSGSQSRTNSGTSSTTSFGLTPAASSSLSSARKPLSERRAEAKSKRENLGAMKLETKATKKGDEWDNWDF